MALLSVAVAATAVAHETDQFSVPVGREFVDLRFYFSNDFRAAIVRGVEKTNARIRAAVQRDASEAELQRLQSPDVVTRAVWGNFPPVINQIEMIDATLHGSKMKSRYPGLVVAYRPWIWIYHHPMLLLDITKAVRLGRSSTLMVDGVYFGTDKIAHFVHMGILYFDEYRRAKESGVEEAEAVRRAIDLGAGGNPFLSENTLLGLFSTGVRSNGDLAANYLGFKFFRNLTESQKFKGRVEPALLVRDGAYWRLNDHVRENTDWFTMYVSDHWNEALNPNAYGPGIGNWVCEGIRSRCDKILDWYRDKHGRRRGYDDFVRLAQELSNYYGEDYGYQGVPAELTSVHQCCFDESDAKMELARTPTPVAVDSARHGGKIMRASAADPLGSTPHAFGLLEAIRLDDQTAAEQFLGSASDVKQTDRDGNTPLHHAARWGRPGFVKTLLTRGADVNTKGVYGTTPLHVAARESEPVVVRLLLDAGAKSEARDDFGCTPLHNAAIQGNVLSIRMLLDAGANANARDAYANTPLHRAARAGHVDAVELLLAERADASSRNDLGHTAAYEAESSGHRILARMLRQIERGLDDHSPKPRK